MCGDHHSCLAGAGAEGLKARVAALAVGLPDRYRDAGQGGSRFAASSQIVVHTTGTDGGEHWATGTAGEEDSSWREERQGDQADEEDQNTRGDRDPGKAVVPA